MKNIFIAIAIGIIVFEIIEHIVFPVYWMIAHRKKRSSTGVPGMFGRIGVVKRWRKDEGQILVGGELWEAVCDIPLSAGDRVVIQDVRGLVLKVTPQEPEVIKT